MAKYILFEHIPKTAGLSMRKRIDEEFGKFRYPENEKDWISGYSALFHHIPTNEKYGNNTNNGYGKSIN